MGAPMPYRSAGLTCDALDCVDFLCATNNSVQLPKFPRAGLGELSQPWNVPSATANFG